MQFLDHRPGRWGNCLPGDAIPAPDGIFGSISVFSVTSFPNLSWSLPNLQKIRS